MVDPDRHDRRDLSKLHGVPYSPKLAYGLTGSAARQAHIENDGTIVFASGRVDFSPRWNITPESAPSSIAPVVYRVN